MTTNAGNQYLRKIGLIVGNASNVLDLSQLEVEFVVRAGDFSAPTTAYIRVFNPQPSTISSIQTEYKQVSLQAGYVNGKYGIIFSGDIMQVKTGKLENVTRYIDVMASDGDLFHSNGFINTVLAPGASKQAQLSAIQKSLAANNITLDPSATTALAPSGGILPRGKVLFGLGKIYTDSLADSSNATWWIENGVLKAAPLTGYLSGQAVVINSSTGMVGVPEATEQGINVRTLLNPLIKVGNSVKLNNNEIAQTQVNNQGFPNYTSIALYPNLDPNGLYRVLVVEHSGGIRKNPWYSDLVCLAIDQSSGKVQAYG